MIKSAFTRIFLLGEVACKKCSLLKLGGSLLTGRRSVQSAVTALGAVVTLGGRRSAWHLIRNAPDP
jgi:hypothetical protein